MTTSDTPEASSEERAGGEKAAGAAKAAGREKPGSGAGSAVSDRVAALRRRCYLAAPQIVVLREPPDNNGDSYAVLIEAAKELGRQFGEYVILIDCSEARHRPKGAYLELIHSEIRRSEESGVLHWSIVQPSNAFLRTVMRFLLSRVHGPITSVHDTMADALVAARRALNASSSG